ncbi:GapA-binding peptide SR1P [Paenibacillus allorhizosphaerae]|uniref:GapA-binding peptide SR1P n=1 Tax=Paenibacillus allorhizosphaerae TaxID=2849866 RepID=UPI001C401ACC|nr:GapA-binding peptide SR1P [Paenibacillus allorhizosphaerae]
MHNASPIPIELGTIICKHCMSVIGTIDSEKVTLYYSECPDRDCINSRINFDKKEYDANLRLEG